MQTQSPFLFLEGLIRGLPAPDLRPPAWALDELKRRLVLLLNHVLMQEPEAMARIARQKGRVVRMSWRSMELGLMATRAGLLDLAASDQVADLRLSITEESASTLLRAALAGEKPAVRVEGDVMLAAELNWLVDHVRWDLEEDLSRVLGDVPGQWLGQAVRQAVAAIRQFLGTGRLNPFAGSAT